MRQTTLLACTILGIGIQACSSIPPAATAQRVPSDFAYVQSTLTTQGTIQSIIGGNGRPNALYQIGSVSKYACTLAILGQEKDKLLSLDAPLSSVLSGYLGSAGGTLTIRDLLQNRSGLPDQIIAALRVDTSVLERDLSTLDAANLYAAGPVIFRPGSKFDYVIANWVLIQAVLEAIDMKSIEEVLQQRVFKPAGMSDSLTLRDPEALSRSVQTEPPSMKVPAFVTCAGGVASTPADLLKLVRYSYQPGLLSAAGEKSLTTVASPNDWYALGGRIKTVVNAGGEHRIAWLNGSNGAFKSNVAYDPVKDIGFAIVTNENARDELAKMTENWVSRHYGD